MLRVIEGGHGRKHDLPPFWDGLAVVWDSWELLPLVHMCGRGVGFVEPCQECGSTGPRRMAVGLLGTSNEVTHADLWRENRVPVVFRQHRESVARRSLIAFRCLQCLHDVVLDSRDGQVWDLEPIDYCESGSVDPAVDGVLF
jgi:hypothetical protein